MKFPQKLIFTLFISFLLAACGPGSENKKSDTDGGGQTEVKENKSRPEGKTIKVKKEFKINPEDEVGFILNEEHYDQSSKMLKLITYDYYGSGEPDSETNYMYDANGNKVEMDDGKTKTTYEYNEKNKAVKETWARASGDGASEDIVYDEHGERVESKYYDANGKYDFSRVRELSYDEKGNIIEEKQWEKYSDGSADLMQYWIKYEYAANGKVSKMSDLRENGSISSHEERTYDAAGNLTHTMDFEEGGTVPALKESNEYNEYGEVVKDQAFNCSGQGDCSSLQYTNEYKYDEAGRNVWNMYRHTDGEAWGSRFEYEYYE